jgi:phage-related protein
MMKPASFHTLARDTLQDFSKEVRMELGKAIFSLQKGESLSMPLSRPMSVVAAGVHELRVKDRSGIYRVFYFTKQPDRIFIFHAFTKKTQETPKNEIVTGRRRLREMLDEKN